MHNNLSRNVGTSKTPGVPHIIFIDQDVNISQLIAYSVLCDCLFIITPFQHIYS